MTLAPQLHIRRPLSRLLGGLLVIGFAGFTPPAIAVDVWVTSGDKSRLLSQQPDVVFEAGQGSGGVAISVDATQRFQTMEGYGAAMTNSSASLLRNQLSAAQRERLMNDLFSTNDGVGLNYLRLAIGASDFTADGFYTYNDLPAGRTDPLQRGFSIDPDRATILPSLAEARAVNPALKLMASPWSAPAWMKTSGSLIGGSLAPEWQASYATYLRRFVEAYAAEGQPIDALTLQNEPLFTPGDYPGMQMLAAQQIDLVKHHVGPEFAHAGLDTKLLAYDHNWDNTAYPISVLNDPDARQYLSGTAFHGYAGNVSAQSVVHDAHPDKAIYFTEITGGDFAPNFEDNLVWNARNLLIGGARNWGSTVLLWNLALDENHNPHQGGCGDCRGVVTIDSSTGAVTHNEEFYALAHGSRFVQPGAVRIGSNTIGNVLETVAFENPDGSRAMIALNPTGSAIPLRTTEQGKHFRFDVPARSMATLVWEPTDRADFDNGGFELGGFEATGGSLDAWLAWGVSGDNVGVTTALAAEGEHALRLSEPDPAGGFSGVSQRITVEAGDRLTLDAEVLLPAVGSIAGTGNTIAMKVEYYSVHGGQFQSADFLRQTEIVIADGTTDVGEWVTHEIEDLAPDGAVEARLVFVYSRSQSQTGAALIDNIRFAIAAPLAGDFNRDGIVDAADYTVWRDNFGGDESLINHAGDGQNGVDQNDYDLWADHYGQTNPLAALISGPAPEPGALCLAFLALVSQAHRNLRADREAPASPP